MKKFFSEFKKFALKGNVMDLAVGVIIGGAFSTITNSLVNDVIMPVVSMFLGGVNFESWTITLPQLFGTVAEDAAPITLNYGLFISTVINFIILALVVFIIVKFINGAKEKLEKKKEEKPAEPPKPSNEEVLLAEIRDLLKERKDV